MDKIKILIVDDNEPFLGLLVEYLNAEGYEIEKSINGNDAKNKFVDFMPNIVVTDVVMPDADGIELLLELRKLNADVRIVVMSGGNKGHADTYLHMANKLGADAVLNKPFELSELLHEIKNIETSF